MNLPPLEVMMRDAGIDNDSDLISLAHAETTGLGQAEQKLFAYLAGYFQDQLADGPVIVTNGDVSEDWRVVTGFIQGLKCRAKLMRKFKDAYQARERAV